MTLSNGSRWSGSGDTARGLERCQIKSPQGQIFRIRIHPEPRFELEAGPALPAGTPFEIEADGHLFRTETLHPKHPRNRALLRLTPGLLCAIAYANEFRVKNLGDPQQEARFPISGGQGTPQALHQLFTQP